MSAPEAPRANRRRQQRKNPLRSVKVVCRKGTIGVGADLALGLLDLSESGARLVVRDELKKRQEITLAFDSPRQGRPIEVAATVLRCEPAEGGGWLVGVALDKTLPYAELLLLTTV